MTKQLDCSENGLFCSGNCKTTDHSDVYPFAVPGKVCSEEDGAVCVVVRHFTNKINAHSIGDVVQAYAFQLPTISFRNLFQNRLFSMPFFVLSQYCCSVH